MSHELSVTIPRDNGYASQLSALSRVEAHLGQLPHIKSAKIESQTNPFTVSVVPPEMAFIVGRALEKHYGFIVVPAGVGDEQPKSE